MSGQQAFRDLPPGWVRLLIQVGSILVLSGVFYAKVMSMEEQLRDHRTELAMLRDFNSIRGERLASLETAYLAVSKRLESIENKLDRVIEGRR